MKKEKEIDGRTKEKDEGINPRPLMNNSTHLRVSQKHNTKVLLNSSIPASSQLPHGMKDEKGKKEEK